VEYIEKIETRNIIDVYRMFACQDLLSQLKDGIDVAVAKGAMSRLDIIADVDGGGVNRAYRITNTPMLDDGLRGVIVNWSDTTDIMNAKHEAEQANRSKSNFLATMSHEIRTPMNAMLGIAQMHLQKGDLPGEYAQALEKIYGAGNNLLGIINDILDMSKIETGKLELHPVEYDMPNLINDSVQMNIVRIGSKPIEFILDIDANLPSRVYGDELRLKQILNNLLSNAIKYTQKGYVILSADHTAQGDDIMLRFAIEDSGQGMKSEDSERLFSEYLRFNAQTNRATEGTGLGLTITKQLVEMMGGAISMESEYGQGSTFTVTMKQRAVACDAIGPELAKQLRNFTFMRDRPLAGLQITRNPMPYGKVLVVDDVEANLYVAGGLLAPYSLQIDTANSGFAAIDKVRGGQSYDIIFMDHMMPYMDGIETTQKLRVHGYTGVIVALTANVLVGNDAMFMKNGFDGFIPKPIDVHRLDALLNKHICDRYPLEAKKHKP
jgi:signal transduction histidine kinase/CheY-like chemotaxis protein